MIKRPILLHEQDNVLDVLERFGVDRGAGGQGRCQEHALGPHLCYQQPSTRDMPPLCEANLQQLETNRHRPGLLRGLYLRNSLVGVEWTGCGTQPCVLRTTTKHPP